jgi:hypothetical protein
MPGVTYTEQLEFTPRGPVVAHVISAPRPGGLYWVRPVLSNDAIVGRERLTEMQRRLSATATVAGIDGDLFTQDGQPNGILIRAGSLEHKPLVGRSSVGFDKAGTLHVDRVGMLATWQGTGQRLAINGVNEQVGSNEVSLFTPSWGPITPASADSVELVLSPLPATPPSVEVSAPVVQLGTPGGGTPIPPGGAVLVGRGTAAAALQAEAPVGQTVKLRLILRPDWTGIVDAIGGGPILVRSGAAVFRSNESFTADQLFPREARSAVGQTADGRILLVTVDGGLPGYSVGVTNFELALTMVKLGAVTASALDGAASAAMAFDGELLNKPSAPGGEVKIADALMVGYTGVYAPPPLEDVLSPDGDGVGERQRLAYKVVRPSTVNVSLLGPDGAARFAFAGQVAPGTYPLDFSGLRSDGSPEVEGRWRWVVSATDDQGQSSSIERTFLLDRTIGFGKGVAPALPVPAAEPRAVARFTLAHAARVTPRIETLAGVVLRTLPPQQAGPGPLEVDWDGTTSTGAVVATGRYVVEASAANEYGEMSATATFGVRRAAAPGAKS